LTWNCTHCCYLISHPEAVESAVLRPTIVFCLPLPRQLAELRRLYNSSSSSSHFTELMWKAYMTKTKSQSNSEFWSVSIIYHLIYIVMCIMLIPNTEYNIHKIKWSKSCVESIQYTNPICPPSVRSYAR
jgi:hypothetical protein